MKNIFFSFIFFLTPMTGKTESADKTIFLFSAENHCQMDFLEQQRQANRDLLLKAELECGRWLAPIQITETKITENHSCPHYRLGVMAEATFKCQALTPSRE